MTGEKQERSESSSTMMGDFSGMAISRWSYSAAPGATNPGFATYIVSWFIPGRNLNLRDVD